MSTDSNTLDLRDPRVLVESELLRFDRQLQMNIDERDAGIDAEIRIYGDRIASLKEAKRQLQKIKADHEDNVKLQEQVSNALRRQL